MSEQDDEPVGDPHADFDGDEDAAGYSDENEHQTGAADDRLYREDAMDSAPAPKRARKGGGKGHAGGVWCIKVLVPDHLTANLIGRNGATRQSLQDDCGVRTKFSGRDEFYPGTKNRCIGFWADAKENVELALDRVLEHLVAVANEEGGKASQLGQHEQLGKDGEYIFRCALPRVASGRIIGPKGVNIKKLRDQVRAKVFVENETYDEHQMMRVIGSTDGIKDVFSHILDAIYEEVPEGERSRWPQNCSFAGMKGGGGMSKGDGRADDMSRGRPAGRGAAGTDDLDVRERRSERERRHDLPPPPRAPPVSMQSHHRGGQQWRQAPVSTRPDDILMDLASTFPEGGLDMPHAISCHLRAACAGHLIGRRGEYVNYVKRQTGAEVSFDEVPKGEEVSHRKLTIQGPLLSCYAAHLMMMQRYHEDEREAAKNDKINDLQAELARLTAQLGDVQRCASVAPRGSGGPVVGGGKGGGRSRR
eukprot:TRINITY_DN11568_c0_g1_i1.p1 TRINITY_DN11568_c0_g1~~TRINITY_DN11568_c0_g1_i1.p1  ORF type:complete len:476 (-),score=67.97 TRINITY_DN11568_c0_g1_i1:52-1479(-)